MSILTRHDWDIIEVDMHIDPLALKDWHNSVVEKYNNLWFNFSDHTYIKEDYFIENLEKTLTKGNDDVSGYDGGKHIKDYIYSQHKGEGSILCMQLSWLCEKEIPIPPKWAAKSEFFPELQTDNWQESIQKKFNFGYFKTLYDQHGYSVFRDAVIRYHTPGAVLPKHTDGPAPSYRLHIPVISHDKNYFLFGENLDRKYIFKEGKAYLINTSIPHQTGNENAVRSHIQCKPILEKAIELAESGWILLDT